MIRLSYGLKGLVRAGDDNGDEHRRAQHMGAAGRTVIRLTPGDHDAHTDPERVAAMCRAARSESLGDPLTPGARALRDAGAARADRLSRVVGFDERTFHAA